MRQIIRLGSPEFVNRFAEKDHVTVPFVPAHALSQLKHRNHLRCASSQAKAFLPASLETRESQARQTKHN